MAIYVQFPTSKQRRVLLDDIIFVDDKAAEPREGQSYTMSRKFTRYSLLRDDRDPLTPIEERDVTIIMEEDYDQALALVATDFKMPKANDETAKGLPSGD